MMGSYGFQQKIYQPTRGNNCLNNIFTNFDTGKESAGVVVTDLSEHDAQFFQVSVLGRSTHTSRVIRPLNIHGFNTMHQLLGEVDWAFMDDSDLDGNACFNMFHRALVDVFRFSFPERQVKPTKSGSQSGWFTDEHRRMREQLLLVRAMCGKYASESLYSLKNHLTKCYKIRKLIISITL